MAWGPQGEYKRTSEPTTKDAILERYAKLGITGGLADFVETIKDDDELTFEKEGNNHHGSSRYVGRRKNGFTYVYVISTWMS